MPGGRPTTGPPVAAQPVVRGQYIYLAAQIALLAAEGNEVAKRRLSPRSFSLMFEQPLTTGDKKALIQRGKVEERRHDKRVEVQTLANHEKTEI